MICPLCEAEIEDGSILCKHCGKPIQSVPDYNVLEDDLLPAMLSATKKKPAEKKVEPVKEDKKMDPKVIVKKFAVLFGAVVVLVLISVYNHSFSFYYKEAVAYDDAKDYENAVIYYEKALSKSENYDAYMALGNDYYLLEEYKKADDAFTKALELQPDSVDAITQMAKLYEETENSKKLNALFDLDLTEDQAEVLKGYASFAPTFSLKGGKYDNDVSVILNSNNGFDIYYTLDGTAPSEHNGKLYTEPVVITNQGKTTLNAVCVNGSGKTSNVASETYEISYVIPATPEATPPGGKMTQETYITITCETEGASLYYTWDETMPTVESAMYTEPIPVPEGNNILTVIAIDSHGMSSEVFKSNYIYYP